MLENTEKCPVCGSMNASRVHHQSSQWGELRPEMQFCEECGCVYVDTSARENAKYFRRFEERRKAIEEKEKAEDRRFVEEVLRKCKKINHDWSGGSEKTGGDL